MGGEGLLPEHANLIDDMVPSAGGLELLSQQPVKFLPHLDNAAGHRLDILLPLLEQLGVVQNQSDQSRAMSWGIADLASTEDGELTADLIRNFGRRRDDVKGANTFAVQTSVLGEALADQQRNTTFGEFPNCPCIPVQITTGETLIGGVEEGVMTLLHHHIGNLTPLFLGRIYTGRVVGAGVKEEDGTVRSGGKGSEELIAGETDGLGVVVFVGGRIDSDVSEDSEVVYCKSGKERFRGIRRFARRTVTYPTLGH